VKQFLIFSFLVVFSFCAKAQDAAVDTLLRPAVIFNAADSITYSVWRGEELFGDSLHGSFAVDGLFPEEQLFEVRILQDPMVYLRTRVELDTSWVPQISVLPQGEQFTLELLNAGDRPQDYTQPNAALYELEVQVFTVSGDDCAPPALPSDVRNWIADLQEMEFERNREKYLKRILNEECLTISQSRQLISTIDDEEKRLELLKAGHQMSFEKDRYHELNDLLYLDRSQTEFLNWLLNR
jgi:hypothetical protein